MGILQANAWAEEIRSQLGLLRELNDLKRLYSRNLGDESWVTCIFRRACEPIGTGNPLEADLWGAAMIIGARLGAITPKILTEVGLDEGERIKILERSIQAHDTLPKDVRNRLRAACPLFDRVFQEQAPPVADWVERLIFVPRAGATCPGKPRIALEPAEMHSDHCGMVALYGYLLADIFGANREDAWLIGLCHHFHNAYLPDAGFTGEKMLGEHLERVLKDLRGRILLTLPPILRLRIQGLFEEITQVETPLAKTFQAADTLDRVIQMENYERAGQFRMRHALVDLNLLHEGVAQSFQRDLLASIGLGPEPAK